MFLIKKTCKLVQQKATDATYTLTYYITYYIEYKITKINSQSIVIRVFSSVSFLRLRGLGRTAKKFPQIHVSVA